jgi:lactoylglutathione lyase
MTLRVVVLSMISPPRANSGLPGPFHSTPKKRPHVSSDDKSINQNLADAKNQSCRPGLAQVCCCQQRELRRRIWIADASRPKQNHHCPQETWTMRYLHTMLRVRNLETALKFFRDALGLKEVRRVDNEKAKFTLVFLCAPEDENLVKASKGRGAPLIELTYNWDEETYGEDRYFGHLAYEVEDIYATCERLMKLGVTINRPPRDGQMAFIRSPDLHSIELLQKGDPRPPAEPWSSMPNTGHW